MFILIWWNLSFFLTFLLQILFPWTSEKWNACKRQVALQIKNRKDRHLWNESCNKLTSPHFPPPHFSKKLTKGSLLLQLAMATVLRCCSFFFPLFLSFYIFFLVFLFLFMLPEQNGAILNDNPCIGLFNNKSHYKVDKHVTDQMKNKNVIPLSPWVNIYTWIVTISPQYLVSFTYD